MMKISPSTSSRTVDVKEPRMRILSLREGLEAVSRLSGK